MTIGKADLSHKMLFRIRDMFPVILPRSTVVCLCGVLRENGQGFFSKNSQPENRNQNTLHVLQHRVKMQVLTASAHVA